jgi:hypothetical protein
VHCVESNEEISESDEQKKMKVIKLKENENYFYRKRSFNCQYFLDVDKNNFIFVEFNQSVKNILEKKLFLEGQ